MSGFRTASDTHARIVDALVELPCARRRPAGPAWFAVPTGRRVLQFFAAVLALVFAEEFAVDGRAVAAQVGLDAVIGACASVDEVHSQGRDDQVVIGTAEQGV